MSRVYSYLVKCVGTFMTNSILTGYIENYSYKKYILSWVFQLLIIHISLGIEFVFL